MVGFDRNARSPSSGIDGRLEPDYAPGMARRRAGPHQRHAAVPPPRAPALGVEGHPRAGEGGLTASLTECLHLSYRRDLLIEWHGGNLDSIFSACDQYESFEDWPYPFLYQELFSRYGDSARFVLTTRRSTEAWLTSVKNHSLRTHPTRHGRLLAYGYAYPHGVERQYIARYEAHNQEVISYFREQGASHLLLVACWEEASDWRQLCSFVGEQCPPVQFPHENRFDQALLQDCPFLEENLSVCPGRY